VHQAIVVAGIGQVGVDAEFGHQGIGGFGIRVITWPDRREAHHLVTAVECDQHPIGGQRWGSDRTQPRLLHLFGIQLFEHFDEPGSPTQPGTLDGSDFNRLCRHGQSDAFWALGIHPAHPRRSPAGANPARRPVREKRITGALRDTVVPDMNALKTPPRLAADTLRIIPLGGLGDIGRNMAAFEINGKILLVDCGVLFPEDSQPGVDLILPGLDFLDDRLDDVIGLVLTHGHEDHIGAVPYLLRRRQDIALYGSRLTLAFIDGKLREHRLRDTAMYHQVVEGDRVSLDEFDLEFFAVNHSIPDALAVAIKTSAGVVLHTGDYKMDQLPLDGRITDLRGFARLSLSGVDLLMADSTNAEVPGFTAPEHDVEPALERVFGTAKQKLVVACFASHVHRVQQIMDLAVQYKRKVVYVGRSMVRNMAIAQELGFLHVPGGTLIEMNELDNYADDEVVLVSTGSQGEPLSALSRMSNREHPAVEVGPGDTVLLASSLIPGNENAVHRVINGLTRLGVNVVHKGNAFVHTSGHASAGELLYTYNVVKPRNALPIHGEARHLVANARLAQATGVPAERCIVAFDGDVIDLYDGVARRVGRVDASYIFVDGSTVGDVTESSLTDRRILGEEGFISVISAVDLRSGTVVAGPDINARGFLEDPTVFDSITSEVRTTLIKSLNDGVDDTHQLQQAVRRVVGRWVSRTYRSRPMIVPVVISV
jgi:ribonuclease J